MSARILILDGNTPDLTVARLAVGLPGAAEGYGAALRRWRPDLEIEIARPFAPGYDASALTAGIAGLVLTGSAVIWSASDAEARPFVDACAYAFSAGIPVLGCCWGLQCGAVALGGTVGPGPNGVEAGIARDLTLTTEGLAHPLHAGRSPRFDALCMHRDDVLTPPEGALVTASNAHTRVQAMVYEQGQARFWGLQYHPELRLADIAFFMERAAPVFGGSPEALAGHVADLRAIDADPEGATHLTDFHGIGPDITDPATHGRELGNWIGTALGLSVVQPA